MLVAATGLGVGVGVCARVWGGVVSVATLVDGDTLRLSTGSEKLLCSEGGRCFEREGERAGAGPFAAAVLSVSVGMIGGWEETVVVVEFAVVVAVVVAVVGLVEVTEVCAAACGL